MRFFTVFRGAHQKQFFQSTPSEDCLLIRKNTNIGITKTVELEMLCFQSRREYVKTYPKSAKLRSNNLLLTYYCSVAPILFKSIGITICLKAILWTTSIVRWGFLTFRSDKNATYKQSLCSNDFLSSLPSEPVCIISGGYTRCDFYRIFSATMICLPSKNFCAKHFQFLTSLLDNRSKNSDNGLKFCTKRDLFADCNQVHFSYFLFSTLVALNMLILNKLFRNFKVFCLFFSLLIFGAHPFSGSNLPQIRPCLPNFGWR